jgi:hypothetical protein
MLVPRAPDAGKRPILALILGSEIQNRDVTLDMLSCLIKYSKQGGNSTRVIYHNCKAVLLIWEGGPGAPDVEIDLLRNDIRFAVPIKSEVRIRFGIISNQQFISRPILNKEACTSTSLLGPHRNYVIHPIACPIAARESNQNWAGRKLTNSGGPQYMRTCRK